MTQKSTDFNSKSHLPEPAYHKVKHWVEKVDWRWAKSAAKYSPHWYVVKDKLEPRDQPEMQEIIDITLEHGIPHKHYKTWYPILVIGDYRYWPTGGEMRSKYLMNRAKHSETTLYTDAFVDNFRKFRRIVERNIWSDYTENGRLFRYTDAMSKEEMEFCKKFIGMYGMKEKMRGDLVGIFYYGEFRFWMSIPTLLKPEPKLVKTVTWK